MIDCPICFNIITNSAIGSCTHHFCKNCLIRWCEFGGTTCPTCKMPISHIRSDPEFDSINNPEISSSNSCYSKKLIVDFKKEDTAGVTLTNNYKFGGLGYRGPGVIIAKINEKCKCYESGLRKNDVLIYINNIPCIDHKQCIDIINSCANGSILMICDILQIIKIEK